MGHEKEKIPKVLKHMLLLHLGLLAAILAVGVFMELYNRGEGFLKLTLICIVGLGIHLGYLVFSVIRKSYQVFEGEITGIRICPGRRKYWEVELTDEGNNVESFFLSAKSGVRKGSCYRVFVKDGSIWGIENLI